MGIKNLLKFLNHFPDLVVETDINEYTGKKIAIDISILLYQVVISVRNTGTDLTNKQGEITSHIVKSVTNNIVKLKIDMNISQEDLDVLLGVLQKRGIFQHRDFFLSNHAPVRLAEKRFRFAFVHRASNLGFLKRKDAHRTIRAARQKRKAIRRPTQIHHGLLKARFNHAHRSRSIRSPNRKFCVLTSTCNHRVQFWLILAIVIFRIFRRFNFLFEQSG